MLAFASPGSSEGLYSSASVDLENIKYSRPRVMEKTEARPKVG